MRILSTNLFYILDPQRLVSFFVLSNSPYQNLSYHVVRCIVLHSTFFPVVVSVFFIDCNAQSTSRDIGHVLQKEIFMRCCSHATLTTRNKRIVSLHVFSFHFFSLFSPPINFFFFYSFTIFLRRRLFHHFK